MKALILAAGYATRLRPLTDSFPKQLLPVGGRPMVDWILDRIEETSADEVHLVTNARFAESFERWAEGKDIQIHNDGTTSNAGLRAANLVVISAAARSSIGIPAPVAVAGSTVDVGATT